MLKTLANILNSSILNLLKNQPNILINTSETTMTEWNLGHHLANELKKYIFWLDNDLELTKGHYGNRRPDIVFHKRGIFSLDFLVIEVKKNQNDDQSDINKIKNNWMSGNLNYKYGAYINIWIDGYIGYVFDQQNNMQNIVQERKYINIPFVSNLEFDRFNNMILEIKEIENNINENRNLDGLLNEKINIIENRWKEMIENNIET
jgi:hypothetical protein